MNASLIFIYYFFWYKVLTTDKFPGSGQHLWLFTSMCSHVPSGSSTVCGKMSKKVPWVVRFVLLLLLTLAKFYTAIIWSQTAAFLILNSILSFSLWPFLHCFTRTILSFNLRSFLLHFFVPVLCPFVVCIKWTTSPSMFGNGGSGAPSGTAPEKIERGEIIEFEREVNFKVELSLQLFHPFPRV